MYKEWRRFIIADGSLLGVAAVWGFTFVTVKNAIILLPPFSFNFYRFSLATLVMLLFAIPQLKHANRSTAGAGLMLGGLLFAGYSFQTVGLLYTTASHAGFITGLSVVFVPLICTILIRQRLGTGVIVGSLCAIAGLAFLTGTEFHSTNYGDILIFCCAISFALHIIFVGKYSPNHHTVWLVIWQIAAVAFLSGISAFVFESGVNRFVFAIWPALLITALLATCLAFFTQNYMQRFTSPSHTAIIFTMEPVFAAFFAAWLLQESLTSGAYLGGFLILCGMLLAEFPAITRLKGKIKTIFAPLNQKGKKTAGDLHQR